MTGHDGDEEVDRIRSEIDGGTDERSSGRRRDLG